MLELITEADIIVQLVLLVLLGMSITCWVIIINKWRALNTAERTSAEFLERFWQSRRIDQVFDQVDKYAGSPVAMVFKAGYTELAKLSARDSSAQSGIAISGEDNLTRALRRARTVERTALQKLTTFLATTGSTAPFIGLFGTVWGILRAFQKIGATGQATVATVGPDIAHALIATAVGLAAAIPAVIAFNFFNSRIRVLATEMDNFSDDFLNIVKRHRQSG
ncbi:MAG: protein TolQ [Deltaproteobacteria bacterium]|nr:protein TolQ [Deltaproteobacteria bacterium]HCH66640.1 protein TolQ [Deltaproteobacteria bacterium]